VKPPSAPIRDAGKGVQWGHRPPYPLVRGAGGGDKSALRVKILAKKNEVQRLKSMITREMDVY
jgi:hypothetical protein